MLRPRRGISLIDTAISIIIVGTAAVAMMELMAVGARTNSQSHRLTTGQNLASSLQEATLNWTPAQLTGANNRVYSPPINALGDSITDLNGWSQKLVIQPVSPNNLKTASPGAKSLRVTAEVSSNGQSICSLQWLVFVP